MYCLFCFFCFRCAFFQFHQEQLVSEFHHSCNLHVPVAVLGYLKDSNAAAHSVDIFYVVIDLSARSKSYIITFIS